MCSAKASTRTRDRVSNTRNLLIFIIPAMKPRPERQSISRSVSALLRHCQHSWQPGYSTPDRAVGLWSRAARYPNSLRSWSWLADRCVRFTRPARHRPTWAALMTQDNATEVRLALEGDLTISTVETVHATLRAAIERLMEGAAGRITVDCSAAGEIDLTLVQLLIAARASAQLLGRTLTLCPSPDSALLDALTRGGFQLEADGDPGADATFWFTGAVA
jgi:ABC-type transporter Mla MlaB component